MKNFKIILFIISIIASTIITDYAYSYEHRNRVRNCAPYRDDNDDDDCENTKYKKLFVIITSGDVDVGTFVRGARYEIEPPNNEIEFEIIGMKAKKFRVVLSTEGSDLGNPNDVSITTEWRFSHDYGCNDLPFVSGSSYFFWKKMILGCFITSINISPNARSGNHSFEQVLTVNFLF